MTDGEHIHTIPRANPINAFTLGAILKGSGISVEKFRELL